MQSNGLAKHSNGDATHSDVTHMGFSPFVSNIQIGHEVHSDIILMFISLSCFFLFSLMHLDMGSIAFNVMISKQETLISLLKMQIFKKNSFICIIIIKSFFN